MHYQEIWTTSFIEMEQLDITRIVKVAMDGCFYW